MCRSELRWAGVGQGGVGAGAGVRGGGVRGVRRRRRPLWRPGPGEPSARRFTHPSRSSESLIRVAHPSHSSESRHSPGPEEPRAGSCRLCAACAPPSYEREGRDQAGRTGWGGGGVNSEGREREEQPGQVDVGEGGGWCGGGGARGYGGAKGESSMRGGAGGFRVKGEG